MSTIVPTWRAGGQRNAHVVVPAHGTRTVTVPVTPTPGHGDRPPERPLYVATIEGELYVLWELDDGRVACASAVCPHKPAMGPVLHVRGFVQGEDLGCARHWNLYSGRTGECVAVEGHGFPGRMCVHFGHRDGDDFVIELRTSAETSNV